jgi:hypothetical protein
MKARILKAVVSDGKKLAIGSIVDVSGWRNAKTLVSGRYIEFLDGSVEEAKPKIKEETQVVTPTVVAKPKTPDKIDNK